MWCSFTQCQLKGYSDRLIYALYNRTVVIYVGTSA